MRRNIHGFSVIETTAAASMSEDPCFIEYTKAHAGLANDERKFAHLTEPGRNRQGRPCGASKGKGNDATEE